MVLLPAVPATDVDAVTLQPEFVNNCRADVTSLTLTVILGVWVVPESAAFAATRVATGAVVSITMFLLAVKLPTKVETGSVKLALLPRESLIVPLLRASDDVLT
jgi:hypothetical protein